MDNEREFYGVYMPSFDKYLTHDSKNPMAVQWVDDISETENDNWEFVLCFTEDYNFYNIISTLYLTLVKYNRMKHINFVDLHLVEAQRLGAVMLQRDVEFNFCNTIPLVELEDVIVKVMKTQAI